MTAGARNITLWILQILAGLVFLASGILCLAGPAQMVEDFAKFPVGQWFRYLTGILEITGALWLLVGLRFSRFALYGAILLMVIMTGAIISHLTVLGGSPLPAIVLLLVNGTTAWLRRSEI